MTQDRPPQAEAAGSGLVDQATKLAFLGRPASYPEPTTSVEVRETHMSWVFLTGRYAYKLKKPVRYDFLDFSTPGLRRHFCEEELRLNRRLAPEVYLAVVPLTVTPEGRLQLGGPGIPMDWLVQMRQLPGERMLDAAIRAGTLGEPDLIGLVDLLAGFYQRAPRIRVPADAYRKKLRDAIENNRTELARYGPELPKSLIDAIAGAQSTYLADQAAMFDRRIAAGCIVEGNGDLRPEHVFLGPPVQIIDCLEFEPDFRILDIVDDLASLAMECDQLGEPRVSEVLFQFGDQGFTGNPPRELIAFYKSFRACLRAKLATWHLKDDGISRPAMWQARARSYLALADQERAGLF